VKVEAKETRRCGVTDTVSRKQTQAHCQADQSARQPARSRGLI